MQAQVSNAERSGISEFISASLTEAQKHLWIMAQRDENASRAYNVPVVLRLRGSLDVAALRQAIEDVVYRHEALRTTVSPDGGEQRVVKTMPVDVPLVDFSDLPLEKCAEQFTGFLQTKSNRVFDLTSGPLFRVALVKLEKQHYVLILNAHHIIVDGWSMGVIVRDMAAAYSAKRQGQAVRRDLPVQFRDYATWLHDRCSEAVMQEHESYWLEHLAGLLPQLELPSYNRRPPVVTFRGSRRTVRFEAPLVAALNKLSQENSCTPFMTLLAGYMALLHRLSNQDDLIVGIPVTRRALKGGGDLVGYCVNLLPIRSQLQTNLPFREYLAQVRDTLVEAYKHADYPFATLISKLNLPRDPSRPLLVAATFNMNPPMFAGLKMSGLDTELSQPAIEFVRHELSGNVIPEKGELLFELDYNTDLFDGATITQFAERLITLFERVVADPEQRLWHLPIVTADEQRKLLVDWNATQTDYPTDRCLHQLFEAQVEKTPEATAVVFEDRSLTYAELNGRANQLAHYLHALGVGPDVPVGVCMGRSLEMMVGLYGILKAGGAYVPLDPDYSKNRLRYILEGAQVPMVLIQSGLRDRLPPSDAQVLALDQEWASVAQASASTPASLIMPQNLAYVIYTSGSTGKPKGVAVPHSGIVNRLLWMQEAYQLDATDRVLHKAPFSFDVSVWEFFWPLLTGAQLVVAKPGGHRDSAYLAELIASEQITTLHFVPPMLAAFLEEPGIKACSSLRRVICSGEALPLDLMQRHYARLDVPLHNLYGPTEASVDVTYWACERDTSLSVVPIGRPIANTQMYVLDAELNSVPVGVTGELHIGGVGLARGYLNRPDLTAEKFIPDPFSATPGARLYKTGDLSRYLPDGNIEFLGRIDHQVKIRGFRVELGEIEAVLARYPAVREAVVIAREDKPGDKRLVGYVVPTPGADLEVRALRAYLKEKLPDYMVPVAFVVLDALPLSPNGKVDRRALPAPEKQWELTQEYVAPNTPAEELLAEIWAEVLGVERVGVHDNFFEFGGHSLLATQVVSRLRNIFKVELPLRKLFDAPTVAGLAHALETAWLAEEGLGGPPLEPVSRDGELPLSFAQERLWFLDQLEPENPFYNMPGAIRLQGALEIGALERSLNVIIERHEALRMTFRTVDGRGVQVIAPTLQLALPVIELTDLPVSEREPKAQTLITEAVQAPFDLACRPLLRVQLLRLADDDHILHVTLHHIVADGWSIGVLVDELTRLYEALIADQPFQLPALPIQYADFACWQRQWLQGKVLERQLGYWQEQLKGLPPLLELPTDRPRPPVQTFHGARTPITVSAELTHALRALSHEAGVTLFMMLLAAFEVLLYRYTGQREFAVGSPIANRNRAEIEGLIGFFVNTLALRADLSDDPRFQQLLARTKETTLGAYAHQDVPFERVVDALQPERCMSHSPLFQVMFVLQNAPLRPLALPGLQMTPWALEAGIAKFDLTLELAEEGDEIRGSVEYNTDLFDAATIAQLVGYFNTLLEGIAQTPEARVSELPLLSAAERQQLLVEWNATQTDFPKDQCIHQLFEQQVERTPEATAVVFEDQSLTYSELNARANQLAHYLRTLGVEPEVLVGLCVERSLEMVVGLLGILKAGGAYVPLDPTYPEERLAFMLEDSQTPLLLTQDSLVGELPLCSAAVVCLDRDWPTISVYGEDNPINYTTPENLAYVIYTSGSTGRPKGTQLHHQGLANLATAQAQAFDVQPTDYVLQFASLSFDASVWETFMALTSGARLCLGKSDDLLPGTDLSNLMAEREISVAILPPSATKVLPHDACQALRTLIVGGEACSKELVASWLAGRRFFNAYGPTESTVCATLMQCQVSEADPPIGRAIANTQVYILDPDLNPLPVGVPGELHIGGVQLARGYLNHPDLTAERFIPNPFSDSPGARLYRTGDLARYLADGNIEFLGRIDHQVKLRGFRVELNEIEVLLRQQPTVHEVAVVVREDSPDDKRLVAYLVAAPGPEPDVNELRAALKAKLPEYMVPAAFIFLDALPLTPNGKIDRKALPAPDAPPALPGAYVAPRNPAEQTLADIWAEVLRVKRVGIHDNFFELGGDSILGIQAISRASQAGLELTARQLFEHQTVAGLAAVAGVAREIKAEQGLVAGLVPLTPIQHWFFERPLPVLQHFNQSVLLEVHETLNASLLQSAIENLLEHHDALRMRFEEVTSGWQQTNAEHETHGVFNEVDLAPYPASERPAMLESAAPQLQSSLDIGRGPLVRVVLFRMGPDQPDRLLLIIHHLVVDGVSWRIILEDLYRAYEQLQSGRPVTLPPKTTSFKQWSEQLQNHAQSGKAHDELEYWLKLAEKPFSSLPIDTHGGANTVGTSRTVSVSLSPEETQALLQEVPEAYHTQVNDLLLTALAQTLSTWVGRPPVWVDLEGHGREPFSEELDVSRTVGWFTSLFPLCLDLEGIRETAAAIKTIKEQLRGVPNKGFGYGLLRYLGSFEARVKLNAIPKPEMCFNYLGQFDQLLPDTPFRLVREGQSAEHDADEPSHYLLDVSCMVADGQLVFRWTYSEQRYRCETIERLAQAFIDELGAVIDHCLSSESGGYMPSDFADVDLSQDDLDELLREYESAQH